MNAKLRKRLEFREYQLGDEIFVKVRPKRLHKSLIDEETSKSYKCHEI